MDDMKIELLNKDVLLVVPINTDTPLSEYVEYINNLDYHVDMVIIDLLLYVGNRSNRFQYCITEKHKIELSQLRIYKPTENIVNRTYELLSCASIGDISRIIPYAIRKIILDKKRLKDHNIITI